MRLDNEFASVEVTLDQSGNGSRLKIVDVRTGQTAYFDPLELETLAWLSKDELAPFFDPSLKRWRTIEPGALEEPPRIDAVPAHWRTEWRGSK